MGKTPSYTSTQLVSTHENNNVRVDFIPSLIYLLTIGCCSLKKVLTIVSYRHEKLLAPYLEFLQTARQNTVSTLFSSIIKNLGNSIPGTQKKRVTGGRTDRRTDTSSYIKSYLTIKNLFFSQAFLMSYGGDDLFIPILGKCHQGLLSYTKCSTATNEKTFLNKVKNPNFADFLPLSPDTCIIIHDGCLVKCTNLPGVLLSFSSFLNASTHLYVRICPSVCPSVYPSFTNAFNLSKPLKTLQKSSKLLSSQKTLEHLLMTKKKNSSKPLILTITKISLKTCWTHRCIPGILVFCQLYL